MTEEASSRLGVNTAARLELQKLDENAKASLTMHERQRRYASAALAQLEDRFLSAANRLIRWYSVDCDDFFVEEVGLHQLAPTAFKGILRSSVVDGRRLETIPLVGKVPPLIKHAWKLYSPTVVDALEAHLKNQDDPDFARFLTYRARHLLERTAFRNAIAEAAASLEIAIARAIRKAMTAKGHAQAAIDAELKKTAMRFPDRAEITLKTWCGKGVLELDAALWTQLKQDRTDFRNRVVHSDREPSSSEASDVVDRFIKMTDLVLMQC